MSAAELACRATSVAVTLTLAQSLGKAGYGRIEFAFNVVFWLVLIVRDGFEVIAARELARHPRLVRTIVNHLFAVKTTLAAALYLGLVVLGTTTLTGRDERIILALYGLMLFTTAAGIDYVYRGLERMGILALSLCVRTAIYAAGVWFWVSGPSRIIWVPVFLAIGEASGIALVWSRYLFEFGRPRPVPGRRSIAVLFERGRPVLLIHLSQALLASVDMMVVMLWSSWNAIGGFAAPHRMVTALLTFGLIFQQVVFPTLARSWRGPAAEGRKSLDVLVRVVVLGMIPIAVGTSVLAKPLVLFLFPPEYEGSALLLALGVWRAPLLTLAFLYQTSLIALNREAVGVRLLLAGAISSGPLAAVLLAIFGLPGAASAVGLTALGLTVAGYLRLAGEGRAPAWHHHLARPLAASAVMAITCLCLQRFHVVAAILVGGAVYVAALWAMGGLKRSDIAAVLGRS